MQQIFRRAALCLAIGSATTLAALGSVSVQAAEQSSSRHFEVPAGPLGTALNRFAEQAGLRLMVMTQLIGKGQSPGVSGDYPVAEGIKRLLAGSGLVGRVQADSLVVEPAPADAVLEMDSTLVQGQALGATTENSGSYTTGPMQAATKLPLTLKETPQSATVITRQRIDDAQMNTLNDVVKSTPGLAMQELGVDRQRYYARGTLIDNLMYDGLPVNTGGSAVETTSAGDMAMYDHVEIVRGATGMMQGAGNPSASINLVRKKPTATPQVSLSASAGSWDRYRSELDASGPLNDSGSLRGRIVTAYQNYHGFQDVVKNERNLFYGVLDADLSEDTTLTVGASRQQDNNNNGWGGIPVAADGSDLHLSRSTFLGNDWEKYDRLVETAFATLEHRFANGWKLNLSGTRLWSELDQLTTKVFDLSSNDVFDQRLGKFYYNDRQGSYDLYASGPFQALGREHQLVFGVSKHDESYDYKGASYTTLAGDIDLNNWDNHSVPRSDIAYNARQRVDIEQKSAYATTRLKLAEPLTLILGGRLDWYEYQSSYTGTTPVDYKVTRNVTKYAGMIYDLDDTYSLYTSYTDIFKPQNYTGAGGGLLDPVVGKNYEIGIKAGWFDGRLNGSAALFRMDQENRAKVLEDQTQCATYSSGKTCYEAAGKVRSQGIDLELQGALTPGWQIGAGYSFTQAKYVKDATKSNEGRDFDTDLPKHLLKLSSTYTLPGELNRWRIGGSFYRQSKVYNQGSTYYIEQKAYNLVNLMAGYAATEHLDLQLNFNNVFDKRYYANITDSPVRAENVYGDPRNLMLGVKYKF